MSTGKNRCEYLLLEEGSENKGSASTRKECPKSVSFLLLTLGFCLSLAGAAVWSGYKSGYLQMPDIAALIINDLLFFVGLILQTTGIALIARALTTSPCRFAVTVILGATYLFLCVAVFVVLI